MRLRPRCWHKLPFIGRGDEDTVSVRAYWPAVTSVCCLLLAASSGQAQIARSIGTEASSKIAVSQRGGWLTLPSLIPPRPIPHAAHPRSAFSAPLPRPRPPELAPAKPAVEVPHNEMPTTASNENSPLPSSSASSDSARSNSIPSKSETNFVPQPIAPAPPRKVPPPPPINY